MKLVLLVNIFFLIPALILLAGKFVSNASIPWAVILVLWPGSVVLFFGAMILAVILADRR